ncbi:hypothetical protein E4V51_19060 [Paenibacillus sp. 28ISP30-2]|nr:hypothetical protein [Paenibacillus sp. 28ISP30-2]
MQYVYQSIKAPARTRNRTGVPTCALPSSFSVIPSSSYAAFSGLRTLGAYASVQERDSWCWAAVSQGILRYYDKSVTQANFVRTVKGSVINEGASDQEAKRGLSAYGLNSTLASSSISYSSIITQIVDYSRPIYAGWSWSNGGGHAVLIKGIQNSHLTDNVDWVFYVDPLDATTNKASYSWVKGSNSVGHVWDGTLYNITN